MQGQLSEERRKREDEILAIEEAHKLELLKLNEDKKAVNFSETTFTNVSLHEDFLDKDKDRRIKELEEELYLLRSEHENIREEKELLDANMVALDNQHQMIIDEILKSKKILTEELKQSKDELSTLKKSNTQLASKNVIEFEEKIQSLNEEKSSLIVEIEELSEQNTVVHEQLDAFQKLVYTQKEKIEMLNHEIKEGQRESLTEINRLEFLVKELNDKNVHSSYLQEELNKAKRKEEVSGRVVNEMRDHIARMKTTNDDANKLSNDLRDKILHKDEEILKMEAVLEEKNSEQMNAYNRLKQHEEMTLKTIKEFQKENHNLKKKIEDLIKKSDLEKNETKESDESTQMKTKLDNIFHLLIDKCNAQCIDEVPSVIGELNSEVALLRCERDRLSDELKDTQDLADSLVMEKSDLERECEDLRDQLEELQCGERVLPEGSHTPRPLATIEEEEADNSFASVDTEGKGLDKRTVEGTGNVEFEEKIIELNSQVTALSEARQNLEMELSIVKKERVDLEHRLSEANSQLGNLSNLEAEAANLRVENESLQYRLNNSHKQLKEINHIQDENERQQQQIQCMANAVEKINLTSSEDVDSMRSVLEEKINDQNNGIEQNAQELKRLQSLLNEANISQYQDKLFNLETELDKAKGLVIYKDDQIDQLKLGIEDLGAIFKVPSGDLRHTYVGVKQAYESLQRRITELCSEVESLKDDKLKEEDIDNVNFVDEGNLLKLAKELQQANKELIIAKDKIEHLELDKKEMKNDYEVKIKDLKSHHKNNIREKDDVIRDLNSKCEALSVEKNESVTKTEYFINNSSMLQKQLQASTEKCSNLESTLKSKEIIVTKLQTEISNKEETLNVKLMSLEAQLLLKQEHSTKETLSLETNYKHTIDTLKNEIIALKNQTSDLSNERQQMIETSTKKHQESVTYYNEINRLTDVLRKEEERSTSEICSLNKKLEELSSEKQKAVDELHVIKENLYITVSGSVPKEEALRLQKENAILNEDLLVLKDKLKTQQEAHKNVLKERDHLRMANSSFNAQYEEKSREVNGLEEKEKHLTQEIQRLKQHLVEVEETYTNEAVKSEQRESSLRQSLAKMHEKIASHSNHYSNENQRTLVQLESIQERLNDAVHQRDEVKAQLQISEESSLQHQEALSRLQQVLQDFQKNQAREISMATERGNKKLEEEIKKCIELEIQLKMITAKLHDMESTTSTWTALRDELQVKEDTIVALKSQVNAVNLAAKKCQDQVALLQSTADGKVDKHLLRNLLVGYFATPSDKQREVLRIVAEVLDFSVEERSRTGIDQQPGSWLTSIANFLAPPPSNIRIASKVDVLDHSSLSQAFIRFLEEESSPRTHHKLPAVQMAEEAHQKAQKKVQARNIVIGSNGKELAQSFAPNLPEVANPLLSNASTPQGAFSLISTPALTTAPTLNIDISTPKFLNNLLNPKKDKDEENETNA